MKSVTLSKELEGLTLPADEMREGAAHSRTWARNSGNPARNEIRFHSQGEVAQRERLNVMPG